MAKCVNDWKIGNKVSFFLEHNKYCGTITDCSLAPLFYKVKFISAIRDNHQIVKDCLLNACDIKKYHTRLNSWIFPGSLVEFLTEDNGLKLGIVIDSKNIGDDEYYDFAFYKISSENKIEYCINQNVHRSRITYISTSEDAYKLLPIKKGSTVKFISELEKKPIIGKIHDIYSFFDAPLFSIKYTYIKDGVKWQEIEESVSLENIKVI